MTGNMKKDNNPKNLIINWLLEGDVSVQYGAQRYILGSDRPTLGALQARIETEGFGARYLAKRSDSGHWGTWFYQPKWTCTHYTLALLAELGMPEENEACVEMTRRAFDERQLSGGGINFSRTLPQPDVCIGGMVLSYACRFISSDKRLERLCSFLLDHQRQSGGFGWSTRSQSDDPHTTICVLEGFMAYRKAGFSYKLFEVACAERRAIEYLFSNKLFAGGDKRFKLLSHPYRYRYDLLRVLEYFEASGHPYDARLKPELDWLAEKRGEDGLWRLENIHPGKMHFPLETVGAPSRFITLKALRILNRYGLFAGIDTST